MESNRPVSLSKAAIVFGILGYATFLTFGIRYPSVAARFRELFVGFGADVPPVTRFVVERSFLMSKAIQLIAVCEVILLAAYVVRRTSLIRRWVWTALFLDIAIVIAVVVALYRPIFKLGSVV